MKHNSYSTKFVYNMPYKLEEGVLYIAPHFKCARHLCMCGCSEDVCTPLDDEQWKWSYDGNDASLTPSVGNFQYDCKSHYFLKNGKVNWCD